LGKDIVIEKATEFAKYGKTSLIVTGQNSAKKSGALDDIEAVLMNNNITYHIFNEIMENPGIQIIDKGKDIFLKNNCDFIIAIGGGSPLDAAKAISLQAANNTSKNQIFDTTKHIKSLPIIAIPTTSGTGSEVTQYSVLTDDTTNKKAGFGSELIFPKIAFLDPKYTISLSKQTTLDTAIDALSHLLEGLDSNKYNEFLLPFIYKWLPKECLRKYEK
jgi:alcohol dehydrogenase